jgi:3-oxoacyl-[acyl-carrier protein] reductase
LAFCWQSGSSVVSRLAPTQNALYVATKRGVDLVTRSLAKELGPRKIRVNSINPGVVETEIGQPADIAAVAVFLASDDARWVTGATLFASGGL